MADAAAETFEDRSLESSDVMPDDWDPTTEDRGDGGLDVEFVPRETPDPESSAEPEQTEEQVAEGLGKAAEPEVGEEPAVEEEQVAEPEAEAAEPEPAVEEPEPEPEKKPHTVPQVRLSKEIERRKAIEEENARLRAEIEASQTKTDEQAEAIQEKMRELVAAEHEAILDGKTDKANELRMQHSELQMELMKQSMAQVQMQATQATKEELAFDQAVAELTAKYPVFDPESEQFDQDMLNDVLRDRDAFYNAGTSHAQALIRAVKISAALNGLDAPETETSKETVDAKPEKPEKDEKTIAKKVAAANQQPPALRGENTHTHGQTQIDVMDLSEEDFEALPEATLKRLRGDL